MAGVEENAMWLDGFCDYYCPFRLAAGHKVQQVQIRQILRREMEEAKAKEMRGEEVASPWTYKVWLIVRTRFAVLGFKGEPHSP